MSSDFVDSLSCGSKLVGNAYEYSMIKPLGQGTFGITYLAEARPHSGNGIGIKVTVKEFFMREINGRNGDKVTIAGQNGIFYDYLHKFINEAGHLSKMHHPNIVRVLETITANNTAYYVMEYIAGGSLDSYIYSKEKLSVEVALPLFRQICQALAYMHSQKMLHLDLKPANIMLDSYGKVKLIDFGLSKQYDMKGNPESSTSIRGGTPGYAPLEQTGYKSGKGFPVTMDIYALGATLFKMVTGTQPFEASVILNEGFPADALINSCVDSRVIDLIRKMMSPMKKDRHQSVDMVLREVDGLFPFGKSFQHNSKANSPINSFYPDISIGPLRISVHDVGIIEMRFVLEDCDRVGVKWFDLVVTPSELDIVIQKNDDSTCDKKSFISTTEKFCRIVECVNRVNLSVDRDVSYRLEYGMGIRVHGKKSCIFSASTFSEQAYACMLNGYSRDVRDLIIKELGIRELIMPNFVESVRLWIMKVVRKI